VAFSKLTSAAVFGALWALLAGGCHLIGGIDEFTYAEAAGGGGPDGCDPATCPGLDEPCLRRVCPGGACGFAPVASGTACSDSIVGVCDGDGACVECLTTEDCSGDDVCDEHDCVPKECIDGVQNGQETDVDCGGPLCGKCENGEGCALGSDCDSGFCDGETCAACGGHGDCPSTHHCDIGSGDCLPKKDDGAVCGAPAQCKSGFCPSQDGVCCAELCAATCEACAASKTGLNNGTCALVDTGLDPDPDGECGLQGPATCGSTGEGCLAGAKACVVYPASTPCAPAVCMGSTFTGAASCNGTGSCVTPTPTSCAPYQCNASATACRTSCAGPFDCTAVSYCSVTGNCLPKKNNGETCGSGLECFDGHCVDGVCCNTPCNGTCVACTAAKTGAADGICAVIPSGSDPDNECSGSDACDGFGACACGGGGNGRPLGACCTMGSQCQSGNCADGVCCNAACGGTCQSCLAIDTGGSDGTCAQVVAGTDPDGECTFGTVCDASGVCSGCGASATPSGGVCPAVCTGGCVNGGTTCVIDCLGVNACLGGNVNCPGGFDCRVRCGPSGCKNATINCPTTTSCEVTCEATQACASATIQCGNGTCDLSCASVGGPCMGTNLNCGQNACSATCTGTSHPVTNCGNACSCDPC
jgi:hypothetical protein